MTSEEVKATLKPWIADVLSSSKRRMTIVEVAREIWRLHEHDLRRDETLFFTWQYEMRWSADELKQEGKLEKSREGWLWL